MLISQLAPASVLMTVVLGGQSTVGATLSLTVITTVQVVVLAGLAPSVAV